ncbi:MAG TPA: CBS domain-containing protein [Pelovirga sp.]|nr:CBS domain-containing protein [Pelovirga sp.]
MKTVKEILAKKGSRVITIHQDKTVLETLSCLVEAGIGAIVVVDDTDKLAGIFSERDLIRIVAQKQASVLQLLVKDVMTSKVTSVVPEQTVDECLALMTEKRFRHLPVVVDGSLQGLISIGDLVKAAIADKEFLIEQLTHYIKSGG